MPQMQFRRLLHDEDTLGALTRHILESVYKQDKQEKEGSTIKVAEMKDLLKCVDKALFN
jgi:hypothetical protein